MVLFQTAISNLVCVEGILLRVSYAFCQVLLRTHSAMSRNLNKLLSVRITDSRVDFVDNDTRAFNTLQ